MSRRNILAMLLMVLFVALELFDSFLGIDAILVWIGLAVSVAVFTVVLLVGSIKQKDKSMLHPILGMVVVVFLWFVTPLQHPGPYVRLWFEEEKYKIAIESAASGDMGLCEQLRCAVEDINIKQVAFQWDGLIDNWYGVCHDPTGTVLKSNILKGDWSNRNDSEYLKASSMFGGTMTHATHLWGNWYLCGFT
jgi:hypothetical protein